MIRAQDGGFPSLQCYAAYEALLAYGSISDELGVWVCRHARKHLAWPHKMILLVVSFVGDDDGWTATVCTTKSKWPLHIISKGSVEALPPKL